MDAHKAGEIRMKILAIVMLALIVIDIVFAYLLYKGGE